MAFSKTCGKLDLELNVYYHNNEYLRTSRVGTVNGSIELDTRMHWLE